MCIRDRLCTQAQFICHLIGKKTRLLTYLASAPPFDKPLSFTKLFDRKTQSEIMATINTVKDNAVIVVAYQYIYYLIATSRLHLQLMIVSVA